MPDWDLRENPVDVQDLDDIDIDFAEDPSSSTLQGNEIEEVDQSTQTKKRRRAKGQLAATPTVEDKQKIFVFFMDIIDKLGKPPNQKQCLSFLKHSNSSLDWHQVKYVVSNQIEAKKRKVVENTKKQMEKPDPKMPKKENPVDLHESDFAEDPLSTVSNQIAKKRKLEKKNTKKRRNQEEMEKKKKPKV